MLSNQTVEILKSLDKKEMKKFGIFLKSPYFNTSEQIVKIFLIAQKTYPDFSDNSLDYEKVFKKLYPTEKYTEPRIKNLYSDFGNLLRKFIGYEQLSLNSEDLDVKIADGLGKKNLNRISNKLILKSLNENDDGTLSIPEKFHFQYRMNVNFIHNLGFLREYMSPEYIKWDIALTEKLTIFFLSNLLQISFFDALNHKTFPRGENTILKEIRNSMDIEKILKYMEMTNHEYASYLKIQYLFFYYTENNVTEENYLELKKEILKTIHKVQKLDQIQFISRIIPIIFTKLIPVDKKYHKEILDFAKLFQELKIYPDADIQPFAVGLFRDIFTAAIILNEDEWAENFIEEFSNYLNKDLKDNAINYCIGVMHFRKGNYEKSLNSLNNVKIYDVVEKINIRFYYLVNYIELKAYESAFAALNSIRQFYNESKEIPEMFKTRIEISLKFFNEIIKCEEKGEKIDDFIYQEAIEAKRYVHVQYILEKMEKLL